MTESYDIFGFIKKDSDSKKISMIINEIKKDTTRVDYWHELALEYERLGDYENAVIAYQHLLNRKNEFDANLYFKLGEMLTYLGRFEEAANAFKEQRIIQDAHGVLEAPYDKDEALRKIINYTEFYERFDIDEQLILYESYHGSSMSCNPYAIFLYLLDNEQFKDYKHIWVINENHKIIDIYKTNPNIIYIKRNSDLYMRYLSKAKYLINNVTFPEYHIRKEKQIYLNTWHGTPVKSLGKDIKDDFMAHKNVTRNFLQASHLIQPNAHTTNILLDRYDVKNLFSGIVAETGYPRQDLMINISEEKKEQIKHTIGIYNDGRKLVLYAPTWRGEHGKAVFDTQRLQEDLEALGKINGIKLLFRGHHMIEKLIDESNIDATIVPSDIDTNALLSIIDILITDYSSIAFDFLAMNKPIIYYTHDREEYEKERGLYFHLEEVSENICENQEELIETVENILTNFTVDAKQIKAREKFCPYDDGNATKRVVDLVFKNSKDNILVIKNNGKKNVILYGGPFIPNGITTSFINLLNAIDRHKYNVNVIIEPTLMSNDEKKMEQFTKVEKETAFIARTGTLLETLEEKWLIDKFNSQRKLSSQEMYKIVKNCYFREYKRLLGMPKDCININFEGYNIFWTNVFSSTFRNVVYLHNDMYGEYITRFPYLEKNFRMYNHYDKLVSVSKQTMEHNCKNLSKLFDINEDKFIYCDNIQNAEYILSKAKEPLEAKEDESIFKNGKVFINIARLSPEKDQEKLIRAFKQVSKKYPDIKLIVLGTGPKETDLKKLIHTLNLKDKVYLLGQRSNPYNYLKKSDCFVMSSNHEGQPMTLFEALILEKPIVATDIVGNRSVLEGRPGFLVENSIDGLSNGMLDFLKGSYQADKKFDYEEYNRNAINMFYERVLNEKSE